MPERLRVRLDHVVIAVSNWERSNAFYRDVLGAEIVEIDRGRWAYQIGNQRLNVHGPGSEPYPVAKDRVRPGNSDLCFVWDGPIDEAAAHLRENGVEIEVGPAPRTGAAGQGMSVYFRDPDGSLLEFLSYAGPEDSGSASQINVRYDAGMPANLKSVVGIDFAAPSASRDQRRKIVAVWAERVGEREFVVHDGGVNSRLVSDGNPGWGFEELVEELIQRPVNLAAADFPFSIPRSLLADADFAAKVALSQPIGGWNEYLALIDRELILRDPIDFSTFSGWRTTAFWKRRMTDEAALGQPPLKYVAQNLFQMTLLGAKLLAILRRDATYAVVPWDLPGPEPPIIEIHPGYTLRRLGLAAYKERPAASLHAILHRLQASDIQLRISERLMTRAISYASGPKDHDLADALVALGTGILFRASQCEMAVGGTPQERTTRMLQAMQEGVIWGPKWPPDFGYPRN